tara:strand:- start:249 stop:821 length:573 start_codon:yes stop_codon:yes gene_type:complete
MILAFFGPPGAGKGTQAKFISKKLKLIHLSTGELLRKQLEKKNELSLQLKQVIDSGKLVSDEILNKIISQRIIEEDCSNGFILDGYPRTLSQATFINEYLHNNQLAFNAFIELDLDHRIIIDRIKNRALIESRADDSQKTIKIRLEKYLHETKPVLELYKKQYKSIYFTIDGKQDIEKINSLLLSLLKKP